MPEPGTFGENLTLSSFGAEPVRIGDRFRIGAAIVEVTAPRIPCSVFATRMGEPDWVNRFAAARRPGLYVRVLEPGEVAAGDPIERLGGVPDNPTVVELMDVWYDREPDPALLERLLAAPLAERARTNVENKLAAVASTRQSGRRWNVDDLELDPVEVVEEDGVVAGAVAVLLRRRLDRRPRPRRATHGARRRARGRTR